MPLLWRATPELVAWPLILMSNTPSNVFVRVTVPLPRSTRPLKTRFPPWARMFPERGATSQLTVWVCALKLEILPPLPPFPVVLPKVILLPPRTNAPASAAKVSVKAVCPLVSPLAVSLLGANCVTPENTSASDVLAGV